MSQYNLRNPAVKRLMKEAEELFHPTDEYHAQPLEDNLFEWHFSIRGPPNSDFEGGIYHGRITLPPDYPMKPPSIILLTPNGRFETNKKICLSISGYHPESWQPSWSIRTALLAIIGFMPTHGNGALGSLDYTPEERKQLALKSQNFKCTECGSVKDIFLKKKSSVCVKDSVNPDSSSNIMIGQNISPVESSVKDGSVNSNVNASVSSNVNESVNSNVNEAVNSNIVINSQNSVEKNSVIRRIRVTEISMMDRETPRIENISVRGVTREIASENRHGVLYLGFVFCIAFSLLILFIRRVFFMNIFQFLWSD